MSQVFIFVIFTSNYCDNRQNRVQFSLGEAKTIPKENDMFSKTKHKPKTVKYITVHSNDTILYDGKWDELPFDEKIIIEYSIRFYDDPNPCYIHRGAVRVRLLAELEESYESSGNNNIDSSWLNFLAKCMGVQTVTLAEFSEKSK